MLPEMPCQQFHFPSPGHPPQFVGGFEYTISKSNGDLNIRVTNYTSLNSAAYDSVPSIPPVAEFPQPFARVPLTTVVQDFDLVIPCN
jgi:hypothetical protein